MLNTHLPLIITVTLACALLLISVERAMKSWPAVVIAEAKQ